MKKIIFAVVASALALGGVGVAAQQSEQAPQQSASFRECNPDYPGDCDYRG